MHKKALFTRNKTALLLLAVAGSFTLLTCYAGASEPVNAEANNSPEAPSISKLPSPSDPKAVSLVIRTLHKDILAGTEAIKKNWLNERLFDYFLHPDVKKVINQFSNEEKLVSLDAAAELARLYPTFKAPGEQYFWAEVITRLFKYGGNMSLSEEWRQIAIANQRPTFTGTAVFLHFIREDLGSDLGYQFEKSNLIVLGTVVSTQPQQHWVQHWAKHYLPDQPSRIVSYEEYTKLPKEGSTRDLFFSDTAIKVQEFLRKPFGTTISKNLVVRVHGYGPNALVSNGKEQIDLEADFRPGEKVILFLDEAPVTHSIGATHWSLTSAIYSKFTQDKDGSFIQSGDPKRGGRRLNLSDFKGRTPSGK